MGVLEKNNRTRDLKNSINSILGQTYSNFEFLICDDGSSVSVQKMLEDFASRDARIRLLRTGNLYSLPKKLNYCLMHANGTFIARQDADDISLEQRFEKQILFLETNPQIAFVGCNAKVICEGDFCDKRLFPEYPTKEDFLFKLPYLHPTLMFRKESIKLVDGYSESRYAVLCEDYDLLLRMYEKKCYGYNLQDELFLYQITKQDYKKRTYHHRINEAIIRYCRFRDLHMLLKGWPYILKPLIVGLLPHRLLNRLKKKKVLL
jgi:glycosyltransferase involved in cell wall biosynthesis